MNLLSIKDDKSQRYIFIDVLKGIGAIAVVMGHCWLWAIPYVYDFHLALFFLIAGYLYNEKKNGNSPFTYMGHKVERLWPKYVFYLCVLTLLHNDLTDLGAYNSIDYYSYSRMIESILYSFIFINKAGNIAGALWFVSTLIISTTLFASVLYICKRVCRITKGIIKEIYIVTLSILFLGFFGVLLCTRDIKTTYHIEVAFAVLPILFSGHLLRVKNVDIKKYLNIFVAILSCGALYYIKNNYGYVDLSASRVYSIPCLYIGAFAGIYLCFYLAKVIIRSRTISKILATIGNYSFEIMALQFVVFKAFDIIYGRINNIPMTQYSRFPFAFDHLYIIYIILGISIPVAVGYVWERLKEQLTSKFL